LRLGSVVGEALLPTQLIELELFDQWVIARDVGLDDVELLNQFVQIEKKMFQGLVDGFVDRGAFGQGTMDFTLPQFGPLS